MLSHHSLSLHACDLSLPLLVLHDHGLLILKCRKHTLLLVGLLFLNNFKPSLDVIEFSFLDLLPQLLELLESGGILLLPGHLVCGALQGFAPLDFYNLALGRGRLGSLPKLYFWKVLSDRCFGLDSLNVGVGADVLHWHVLVLDWSLMSPVVVVVVLSTDVRVVIVEAQPVVVVEMAHLIEADGGRLSARVHGRLSDFV